MGAIIAQVISYLLAAIGGWILKEIHLYMAKKDAEKQAQGAIDDAAKNDDTSNILKP